MVLVLVIVLGSWLVVAAAVVVLCRAVRMLDEEIEREADDSQLAEFRLPFAS